MDRISLSKTRFWLVCAVCIFAIGTLGCCDCSENCCDCENCGSSDELVADHWVVIHEKVDVVGDPWTACVSTPAEDNVAFLPQCLDVQMGETVGFTNYSNTNVTVNHFQILDAPTNPFDLASNEKVVFKVKVQGTRQLFDIQSVSPFDHGGPGMVVRP